MTLNDQSALEARIDDRIDATLEYWIEQLGRLCAQPSISAQRLGIDECAELTATMLREEGFETEILPTGGSPIVFGEHGGRSDRTLLFYNHYDVQPPEPLELWDTPPFTLTRVGDHLYARGVSDDKGQLITRMAATAAVRDVLGELPVRLKYFVEGEEEVGSPNIPGAIDAYKDMFAADGCIWEFGSVDYSGRPEQTLGMRGLCYVELTVETAALDCHSGLGGSLIPNAAWRLVWALSTIKGTDERIRIPGFYDNARPAHERDLAYLAQNPDHSKDFLETYGLDGFLLGMTGGTELRRAAVFEPTATINGLTSGYQGPGAKTVLPAQASAKIDFRLVPDQTPEEIVPLLRAHLDAEGFPDVAVRYVAGVKPARTDPDDPFVQMSIQAAEDVYGLPPIVEPLIGGSGPLHPFIHVLGLPVVTSGCGYPNSRVHAPNENIRIHDFINGIRHTARIITRFAEL
ncbi:MAG: M20/M25/M40 family metallo-hydrolase [Candidatus Promineofilum sp.]|uniref:M20/M25/M40 family metallo-hydrolase n=1 Tax=Promineifilum sp. TaxID=2664178 RepID=UPI002411FF2E|nr:M20/M25/M40 family metallo-hydrolase [Promineifilum sp.]MCO5179185.1 M20/M25/M40 family metallo-hydrolase [Promineifilum sp.]